MDKDDKEIIHEDLCAQVKELQKIVERHINVVEKNSKIKQPGFWSVVYPEARSFIFAIVMVAIVALSCFVGIKAIFYYTAPPLDYQSLEDKLSVCKDDKQDLEWKLTKLQD